MVPTRCITGRTCGSSRFLVVGDCLQSLMRLSWPRHHTQLMTLTHVHAVVVFLVVTMLAVAEAVPITTSISIRVVHHTGSGVTCLGVNQDASGNDVVAWYPCTSNAYAPWMLWSYITDRSTEPPRTVVQSRLTQRCLVTFECSPSSGSPLLLGSCQDVEASGWQPFNTNTFLYSQQVYTIPVVRKTDCGCVVAPSSVSQSAHVGALNSSSTGCDLPAFRVQAERQCDCNGHGTCLLVGSGGVPWVKSFEQHKVACVCSTGHAHGTDACTSCQVGYGTSSGGADDCVACPAGYFSDTVSNGQCKSCTVCPVGSAIARGCAPGADTQCIGCVSGQNFSTTPNSPSCRSCDVCGAGERVNITCTSNTNAQCVECQAGVSFSQQQNSATCTACHHCPPGSGVNNTCTSVKDTQCIACEEGQTFSDVPDPAIRCVPCSSCPSRYPVVSECTPTSDVFCAGIRSARKVIFRLRLPLPVEQYGGTLGFYSQLASELANAAGQHAGAYLVQSVRTIVSIPPDTKRAWHSMSWAAVRALLSRRTPHGQLPVLASASYLVEADVDILSVVGGISAAVLTARLRYQQEVSHFNTSELSRGNITGHVVAGSLSEQHVWMRDCGNGEFFETSKRCPSDALPADGGLAAMIIGVPIAISVVMCLLYYAYTREKQQKKLKVSIRMMASKAGPAARSSSSSELPQLSPPTLDADSTVPQRPVPPPRARNAPTEPHALSEQGARASPQTVPNTQTMPPAVSSVAAAAGNDESTGSSTNGKDPGTTVSLPIPSSGSEAKDAGGGVTGASPASREADLPCPEAVVGGSDELTAAGVGDQSDSDESLSLSI